MHNKIFHWTSYNCCDYVLCYTLNKFVDVYCTYEPGNHPHLVAALVSGLLSDYMSHSGPKLHFLLVICMFCHTENPIVFERPAAGRELTASKTSYVDNSDD